MLYLYNELPELEKKEFEKHLKKCKECSTRLMEAKDVVRAYKNLPKEEPSPETIMWLCRSAVMQLRKQQNRRTAAQFIKRKFAHFSLPTSHFPLLLRPVRIRRIAFAGGMVVLIFIGYLFFQSHFLLPTSHFSLQWSNGIDKRIESLSERISLLQEEKVSFSIDDQLTEISSRISNFKKELQNEQIF